MIPHAAHGTAVQRSFLTGPPANGTGGQSDVRIGEPAGPRELSSGTADPGAIAVARGLASRDPDGSVVFDLGSGPVPPDLPPLPARPDEPAGWHATAAHVQTVQRQETEAGLAGAPSAAPPGSAPATAPTAAPARSTAPPSAPAATARAPGAASPPLDELARQLFGPLAARLKAELRLDRERAGLLTDLRQ